MGMSGWSSAMAVRSDVSVRLRGLPAAMGARISMVVPPDSSERMRSEPPMSRARSRIRTYLRAEERKDAVKLGKALLEKEMRKNHVSLTRFLKSKRLKDVLSRFRVGNEEEHFARIGIGKLALPTVMEEIVPNEDTERESLRPGFFERTVQRVAGDVDGAGIRIEGMDNMLVRFAQCCNPVPGDPVTGWITRGRGVSVHRRGCPRVL